MAKRMHANVYVRWMGAFRSSKGHSLFECISYECTRTDAVACEPLYQHHGVLEESMCRGAIGLLFRKDAIFRVFPKDCWSEYGRKELGQDPSKLYYGHMDRYSDHAEAWAHGGHIEGIVLERGLSTFTKEIQKQIVAASKKNQIKVYVLTKDGLKEVTIP